MSDSRCRDTIADPACFVRTYLEGIKACLDALSATQVLQVVRLLDEVYQAERQVFVVGNGGSAATASHLACDLSKNAGPAGGDWPRLRVISLTENTPYIMALANDLGFERIFAEQIKTLARRDDLVIAISGSGNSPNILEALHAAGKIGARTVGFLGFDGGQARRLVDVAIVVPSRDYGKIEDTHLILGHLVTEWFRQRLDQRLTSGPTAAFRP